MKVQINTGVQKHILEKMEKDKPSSDPEYWAKPGCKHCCGTGKIGTVSFKVGTNTIKNEQLCSCARRRWQKWQDEWMEKRKKEKAAENNNIEATTTRDDETDKVDLEAKLKMIRTRIGRIDDNIAELRSEIFGNQRKLDELPQRAIIKGFEEQISVSRQAYDSMLEDVKERESSADVLDIQAQNLILMAKQKQKAASAIRTETKNVRKGPLKIQETQVLALEAELGRVQKDLNHVSHGPRRKIRIAHKKLERLESRRRRIVIDAGLDPESIPDDEVGLTVLTVENHSSL